MFVSGDNGWFNARLKNVRVAQRKLAGSDRTSRRISRASGVTDANYSAANDVIYLKSLIVSEENMEIFIEKLNSTRNYRLIMLQDKTVNLKEHFPYFFTNPEMVICSIVWLKYWNLK